MFGFLKRLFSKTESAQEEVHLRTLNLDDFDEKGLKDFQATVSKMSGMEFFKGRVEHGYGLNQVDNKDQCPRCQAPTEQQYANFIYNTQVAPRVLLAPAGYFCTKCRTMIVDEKMLRRGATKGFEYRGVLGLDYEDKRPPDIFKTWNGKTHEFVLGPNAGLGYSGSDSGSYSPVRLEKIKRKKRMAKESRKRNRRK